MSILTNQPQRTNTTAPNFSSFSPAVLAAALGNPQLLQHHHQQLQQQFQQQLPHNFPFSLNESSTNSTTNTTTNTNTPSTTPSMIKKEPNIPQLLPTSIPAPSTTPGSSTTSSSSSSTYVPQVEAISPTPEDQKENSNLQAVKEKICTEICKVEKDIASTQYQFDQLEKKQKEIKESQTKPIVDENEDKCKSSSITMTLAEKIYKENRKKAEESHREILKPQNLNKQITNKSISITMPLDSSFDEAIPFYHEFSDTKISQEIRNFFDTVMKRRLVQYFKRQILLKKQKDKLMIDKYDSLHMVWQKKVTDSKIVPEKSKKILNTEKYTKKYFLN